MAKHDSSAATSADPANHGVSFSRSARRFTRPATRVATAEAVMITPR